MSRTIGLDTIWLRPTPRFAHTEYSMEYHPGYIAKVIGRDSVKGGVSRTASDYDILSTPVRRQFYDAWDFDFLWNTHDGLVDWGRAGRCTDMGHAVYASDGSDQRAPVQCPFTSPEEVWEFDPVKEYGLPGFDELVKAYEEQYQRMSADFPEQVVTGGYYKTVISGAIQIFGWDMLLQAAADKEKFARVLDRIGSYSLFHATAWAKTSIQVYIQHDDMVWTSGPFMSPAFYRSAIFPIYRTLWVPLKQAGKKVIYCSDGTYDMFIEDIAACGADGFFFEPTNDLDSIVKRIGRIHVILGSKCDCRTMAFAPWGKVQAEIEATVPLARQCPGFIWAVGNHIPANVSDDTCDKYMARLRTVWNR